MRTSILIVVALVCSHVSAQSDQAGAVQLIEKEGKLLYRSEMASWHGTDLFLENYKNRENIGGYFSYAEDDLTKCIFFSRSDSPKVIGTTSFDSTFNARTSRIDLSERDFTKFEKDIYSMRKTALDEIRSDTLFKQYNNTNFNLIPLITKNERKVYVLTGPERGQVVIFGNDYLLTFDKNNKLTLKKQLHRNIIPIAYGQKKIDGNDVQGTIHNHSPETGDFITATDICTLMLYGHKAGWKTHTVVSAKYVNLWFCETNKLVVMTMDEFELLNKDKEKSLKPKKK